MNGNSSELIKIIINNEEQEVKVRNYKSTGKKLYEYLKSLTPLERGKKLASGELKLPGNPVYQKNNSGIIGYLEFAKESKKSEKITKHIGKALLEPVINLSLVNLGVNLLNTAISGITLHKVISIHKEIKNLQLDINEVQYSLEEKFDSIVSKLEYNVIKKLDIISSEISKVKLVMEEISEQQEKILQNQEWTQIGKIKAGYVAIQDKNFDCAYNCFLESREFYKLKLQNSRIDANLLKLTLISDKTNKEKITNQIDKDLNSLEPYLLAEYGISCYYMNKGNNEKFISCLSKSKKMIKEALGNKSPERLPMQLTTKLDRFYNSIPRYNFLEAIGT